MEILIEDQKIDLVTQTFQYSLSRNFLENKNGEIAFDIDIPMTNNNKKILGFAHRVTSNFSNTEKKVILKIGTFQKEGIAIIKSVSDVFKMTIGLSNSDFFYKIKNKTLKDLPISETFSFKKISVGHTSSLQQFSRNFLTHMYDYNSAYFSRYPLTFSTFSNLFENTTIKSDGLVINKDFRGVIIVEIKCSNVIARNSLFQVTKNQVPIFEQGLSGATNSELIIVKELPVDLKTGDFINCFVQGDCVKSDAWMSTRNKFNISVTKFEIQIYSSASVTDIADFANKSYPEVPFALAPIYNPNALDALRNNKIKNEYKKYPILNIYLKDTFPVSFTVDGIVYPNIFNPLPYVAFLIDKIAEFSGYRILKNIFKNSELSKLVLYNNFIENNYDTFANLNPFYISDSWNVKDHIPQMPIAEFLESLLNMFAATMVVDSSRKEIDIVFIKDIIYNHVSDCFNLKLVNPINIIINEKIEGYKFSFSNAEDFANKMLCDFSNLNNRGKIDYYQTAPPDANIKDYYFDIAKKAYYVLVYDESTNAKKWELFGIQKKEEHFKEEQECMEKECKIAPFLSGSGLVYIENKDNFDSGMFFPYLSMQIGISKQTCKVKNSIETDEQDLISALTFYRGFRPANNTTLPTISHDVYNGLTGEKHPEDNIALRWEGEYGLFATYWQPITNWLIYSTKKVEIEISYLDHLNFKKLTEPGIKRINEQNYIIIECKAELASEYVSNIKIVAYTTN